ncbi:MAG: methyl-accepting chemotaxis protein [Desulforhopalus sp.]
MKQSKRKNYFIKKEFQTKLISWYFFLATGGCVIFMILLGIFSTDPLSTPRSENALQIDTNPLVLLQKLLIPHWVFIIITAVVLVFIGVLFTHRIAGPLFRFEKSLDNMLSHKLNDNIRLRNKDEGKKLASQINDFNRDLSLTLKNIQVNSEAIESLLEQACEKTNDLSPKQKDELNSLFWSMAEKNRQLKVIYSSYTLWGE